MPKQTFYNLPEEKRQTIIETAIDEFAEKPYGKASLSKIVARAGIAKGSMYQYFEDKKDLFLYLLELAGQEKMAYIQKELDPGADFFTAFEQSLYAGVRFSLEHPRLGRLIGNAMEPSGEMVLQEFNAYGKQLTVEYLEGQLKIGQQQGTVRKDIDLHLAANVLYSMLSAGLMDCILERLGVTYHELLVNPKAMERLKEDHIEDILGEVMKLLRNGLARKQRSDFDDNNNFYQ